MQTFPYKAEARHPSAKPSLNKPWRLPPGSWVELEHWIHKATLTSWGMNTWTSAKAPSLPPAQRESFHLTEKSFLSLVDNNDHTSVNLKTCLGPPSIPEAKDGHWISSLPLKTTSLCTGPDSPPTCLTPYRVLGILESSCSPMLPWPTPEPWPLPEASLVPRLRIPSCPSCLLRTVRNATGHWSETRMQGLAGQHLTPWLWVKLTSLLSLGFLLCTVCKVCVKSASGLSPTPR